MGITPGAADDHTGASSDLSLPPPDLPAGTAYAITVRHGDEQAVLPLAACTPAPAASALPGLVLGAARVVQ